MENYWVKFHHIVYVSADCKIEARLLGKEAYNKALEEDPESFKVFPEIKGSVDSISVDEAMRMMSSIEVGPIIKVSELG